MNVSLFPQLRTAVLFVGLLLSPLALAAQDSTQVHLEFMGHPICGTITQFADAVRQRYPLQRRVGGDNYYIFRGTVFGHIHYLKAEYSRKNRTVFKITVETKNIDENALLDSLVTHFGTPAETGNGYAWSPPGGAVYLITPQGYDPMLVFIDRQGAAAYKEER
ncbi:MAG: hypothetical protein HUK02_06355 [Bacteroidaceae bacterium]|nr:hypothetical protein [Bacteroidaceae bacterium]